MSKQNKQVVKLNTYKKKKYWQTVADCFQYGYTGKFGNLINFHSYKTSKTIDNFFDKYGNDKRISIGIIVVTIIICLIIWFK